MVAKSIANNLLFIHKPTDYYLENHQICTLINVIMDLDRSGIHMHKHAMPNRSDSHLHAYLQIVYK